MFLLIVLTFFCKIQAGGRPEAVVQALQVLEVREQLERGGTPAHQPSPNLGTAEDLDDGEKALVREMCNVSVDEIFC